MNLYYGFSTDEILTAIVSCAAIVLIIVFVNKAYKRSEYYKSTHCPYMKALFNAGSKGEYLTYKALKSISGYKHMVFNCYIPKGENETTEVDAVLIHEAGLFVIESKNFSGWIFGDEKQREWTQVLPKGRGQSEKNRFFNPIIQNRVHIKWLTRYLTYNDDIRSYVAFSNRCTFKEINIQSSDSKVVHRRKLKAEIERDIDLSSTRLSETEVDKIYEKLLVLTNVEEAIKLKHIEGVKAKEYICPYCGGKLVIRTAKTGHNAGKQFLGCSNYPKCRYTRSIG